MSRTGSAIAVALFLCACGGGSSGLSLTYPDNQEAHLSSVLSRLAAAPQRNQPARLVGVGNGTLFVRDALTGSSLWEQTATVTSVPHLAGPLVVYTDASNLVAVSANDGRAIMSQPHESLHLVGADGTESTQAAVLSTGGGVNAVSRLLVFSQGSLAWELETEFALGAPAVLADLILLPWNNQNLSVLDARSGEEIARLRIGDDVFGTARAVDNQIVVGQNALFLIDASGAQGTRSGMTAFTPDFGELPGEPAFFGNAYEPPPAPENAKNRIQIEFHPTASNGSLTVGDGVFYLSFYRLVMALTPEMEVRWVYVHPTDIIGSRAQRGGLLVADDRGGLTALAAANGYSQTLAESGPATLAARIRLESPLSVSGPRDESVEAQIFAAVGHRDARLAPAQLLLVNRLAGREAPEVTGQLLALCEGGATAATVRARACETLAERTNGADAVVSALGRRTSFLEQTQAAPIAALARAAVAMQERRAVGPLVQHLNSPNTRAEDAAAIAEALAVLGTGSEQAVDALTQFLRLYHADSSDPGLVTALGACVQALVVLAGEESEPMLTEILEDTMGVPEVRAHARQALEAMAEARARIEAEAEANGEQGGGEEGEATEAPEAPPALPARIDASVVAAVLAPVQRELNVCLAQAEGRPRSARMILSLEADSSIESISIEPASAEACLSAVVRRQTFPVTTRARAQRVIYTIRTQ